jgi:hypothetical protein
MILRLVMHFSIGTWDRTAMEVRVTELVSEW